MSNLSTSLMEFRKSKGLTQQQICDRSGLSRVTINRIETGAVDPRASTLNTYAQTLNADFLIVPRELRPQLEAFIKSGGKLLAQPEGISAPKSAVQIALDG